jgi:hypothetical protein
MAIIWVGTGRFNAYIGPVQDYIDRVVAADVAAGNTLGLEVGVRDAYDVFIHDSINVGDLGTSGGVLSQANSIIKAAPIMAGARTLAGALVPLVGPAPTNFNFVAGDYNRKTGLKGDGVSRKYLNSNRNNNADPQNSQHMAIFPTAVNTTDKDRVYMGAGLIDIGSTYFFTRTGDAVVRSRSSIGITGLTRGAANALIGTNRSSASEFIYRQSGTSQGISRTSETPLNRDVHVYEGNGFSAGSVSDARLAFYSIGESLDLALLDARVTTLINTFGAVIP